MNAKEYLDKAKRIYLDLESGYRDALLETGEALHQYVLASIAERTLNANGHTYRGRAIQNAARALKVAPPRILVLIAASQVSGLLGDGKCGSLSFDALAKFTRFLERGSSQDDESEDWRIKAPLRKTGPALFQRAVREEWGSTRVMQEITGLYAKTHGVRKQPWKSSGFRDPAGGPKVEQPNGKVYSPNKAVELCMEIVEHCEDPRQVALLLIARLTVISKRRESMAM